MKLKQFVPALLFVCGLGVGLVLQATFWPPVPSSFSDTSVHVPDPAYPLINPLVDCQYTGNGPSEIKPFQDDVEAFADRINDEDPGVDVISVYFRDLNNGPWFGVDQNEPFAPASLLKLPILMAYYQLAETDPSILTKEYTFHVTSSTQEVIQNVVPAETLQDGKTYQVNDLLRRMIVYSDNSAQDLLLQNIDTSALAKVFNDFGLPLPGGNASTSEMDVVNYSVFFRVLFNASYLNKEYSEEALELLSQSQFTAGLVAGVPPGITVAHKFGERGIEGSSEFQLHDCGIIYYPGHPYLLCIMSKGTSESDLENTIAEVSQYVYTEVNGQFGQPISQLSP